MKTNIVYANYKNYTKPRILLYGNTGRSLFLAFCLLLISELYGCTNIEYPVYRNDFAGCEIELTLSQYYRIAENEANLRKSLHSPLQIHISATYDECHPNDLVLNMSILNMLKDKRIAIVLPFHYEDRPSFEIWRIFVPVIDNKAYVEKRLLGKAPPCDTVYIQPGQEISVRGLMLTQALEEYFKNKGGNQSVISLCVFYSPQSVSSPQTRGLSNTLAISDTLIFTNVRDMTSDSSMK